MLKRRVTGQIVKSKGDVTMNVERKSEEEPGGCKDLVVQDKNWQAASRHSFKSIDDVADLLMVCPQEYTRLKEVEQVYHMRTTQYYFSLIETHYDPADPIRRQCIPAPEELMDETHETIDPLGEEKTSPNPYLVHRYPDRALLLVTGRCFMYCRHCTRKRLWREKTSEPTLHDIAGALEYVKSHAEIREIIVSGGDPLTLATARLDHILDMVSSIPHIEVIRIGTRAPVVLPQRIDEYLCRTLKKYEKLWVNIQFNHPREVTESAAQACQRLQRCGIPLSNQSVLLKGINDDPHVMRELCQKLQAIRVRPYYLFQCDPVLGTWHFRTSVEKGIDILKHLRGYTSGMCIPTFVVDGIDGKGKVPLGPNYLVSASPQGIVLENYKGEPFFYYNPENSRQVRAPLKKIKVNTVGIAFNLKRNDKVDDDEEEYDEIETIEQLKKEIEHCGVKTLLFEQAENFVEKIKAHRPDFILNITEGIGNTRSRESQVPAMLEALKIPYSGSDPIALGVSLDKYLTHAFLSQARIPVPGMYMVSRPEEIDSLENIFLTYQSFIMKPRWEGSSKGIFSKSLVRDFAQLKMQGTALLAQYRQPVLIEEFLPHDEITVGICGNGHDARVIGMMKIGPRQASNDPFIYSIENKRQWQKAVAYYPQDAIAEEVRARVVEYALKAFSALELRDIARIDFRLDKDNVPKVIDINPLPGLSPLYSDLPILYRLHGGSYRQLVRMLLKAAFTRYGFRWETGSSYDT
ncbi:MAG: KamA family radical SAM protein [Candidatus Omnitrophica bacterium]|nr:KamA family radical SAM protein [Candidatus Omnitrophota bacterium]